MINVTALEGRLTRDAEIRYTNGGFASVTFSLAHNKRKKNGDKWEDVAEFYDIKMLGKYGESTQKYLIKGLGVIVTGKLAVDTWEKDGQKRSKTYLLAEEVTFKDSKVRVAEEDKAPASPANASNAAAVQAEFDDDIPF